MMAAEGRCWLCAKHVIVGRNGINYALCERKLHLGFAGVSEEQFTFYTKNPIIKYTGTSRNKTLYRSGIFLQIKNGFAQMEAKLNSSLENGLMNLGKKMRDLVLEQHSRGQLQIELLQHNEQVGANMAGARNDMSAGQLAMQDLKDMEANLV
uniref:Uncharacterized protein n=1 Tax=Glossina palpalis gambiensis TaxID=67801 RepID=A0A1B0BMV2_9MUSC